MERTRHSIAGTEQANARAASKQPIKTVMPRYVELVRVSSRGQATRDTPERQRQALDRLREARPGVFVERIEAVASATLALNETEAGHRLAALVEARSFDELRVSEHDRVLGGRSDDLSVRLTVLSMAMRANAIIVDANGHVIDPADESGMGELDFFLRTFTATRERKLIARRTQGGRAVKAAQGRYVGLGRFPWWLRWDKIAGRVEVVPDRAATIERAGHAVMDGQALAQIVRSFNAEHVLPPQGQRWHVITLTRLLRNPTLVGKRSQSLKGQSFPIQVPAIVAREWFEKLQSALNAARGKRRRECYRADALCRGRIFCAVCDELMHVQNATGGYVYYRCRSFHHLSGLRPCGNRYHRISDVDTAVWEHIAKITLDRSIRDRAARLTEVHSPQDGDRDIARLKKALKAVDDFQIHLLRQKAAGLISDDVYERVLREQAEKRTVHQQELEVVERRMQNAAGLRAITATLEERMATLAAKLPKADFETRQQIFETLVPAARPYGVYVGANGRAEIRGVFDFALKGTGGGPSGMSKQLSGSSSG